MITGFFTGASGAFAGAFFAAGFAGAFAAGFAGALAAGFAGAFFAGVAAFGVDEETAPFALTATVAVFLAVSEVLTIFFLRGPWLRAS